MYMKMVFIFHKSDIQKLWYLKKTGEDSDQTAPRKKKSVQGLQILRI